MRKSNNPNGRPVKRSQLSAEMREKLLKLVASGCTKEGIRLYLELSNDTFYGKMMKDPDVQKMFEHGKELRDTMIRIKQMEVAMQGDIRMLIHLGKNYLGQDDKSQVNSANNISVQQPKVDTETLKELARALLDERD